MNSVGQIGNIIDQAGDEVGIHDLGAVISSSVEEEMTGDSKLHAIADKFISSVLGRNDDEPVLATGSATIQKSAVAEKSAAADPAAADPAAAEPTAASGAAETEEPSFFGKIGNFFKGIFKPAGNGEAGTDGKPVKGGNIFSQIGNFFFGDGGNPGGILGSIGGLIKGAVSAVANFGPVKSLIEATHLNDVVSEAGKLIGDFFTDTGLGKSLAGMADWAFGENSLIGKGADFLNTPLGFGLAVVGGVFLGPLLATAAVPAATGGAAAALATGGSATALFAGGALATAGVSALPYMLAAGAGTAILGGNAIDWISGLFGGKPEDATEVTDEQLNELANNVLASTDERDSIEGKLDDAIQQMGVTLTDDQRAQVLAAINSGVAQA